MSLFSEPDIQYSIGNPKRRDYDYFWDSVIGTTQYACTYATVYDAHTKRPKGQSSQGTKRSKGQNVQGTKRPKGQNVPRDQTSQGTKRPRGQMRPII